MPDILRVTLVITAVGGDVAAATQKLNKHRDAASKLFTDLGATKESIKATPPKSALTPPQAQQGQNQAPASGDATAPAAALLTTTVKGEWPVKGKNADDTAIAGGALREKILEALSKLADDAPLSDEDQQMLFELAGKGPPAMSSVPFGARMITFVSKIPREEFDKAAARAFAAAKSHASILSRAAGVSLGEVRPMSSDQTDDWYSSETDPDPASGYLSEVAGLEPVEISLSITIHTVFAIGK